MILQILMSGIGCRYVCISTCICSRAKHYT